MKDMMDFLKGIGDKGAMINDIVSTLEEKAVTIIMLWIMYYPE